MASSTDAEKNRRKRRLLGLLVFMPLVRLRGSVSRAADGIEESFDAMYDAFDSSASVAGAIVKGQAGMLDAFTTLIATGLQKGYRDGAKFTGAEDEPNFTKLAKAQASKTVNQMMGTTRGWMKDNGNDGFTLSRDRADRAARYTGAEAYFNGLGMAFKGTEGEFEKRWETSSDEPCEECLANEDEEWIPMEDDFQSGHYAPLLHPNCMCMLYVRRVQ